MDIMRALNSRNKNLQVDVQVITLKDNLEHPYFSLIDISKNVLSPNGIAIMEAPYTPYISNYWIKYQGEIVISFNMADLRLVNTNSQTFYNYVNNTEKAKFFEKQQLKKKLEDKKANKNTEKTEQEYVDRQQRFQNDHYNYSFIGKIVRFKQKGNKFVIYFEDLGWKFLQKVPKEFRDAYIAGQYLDDAFQAICEFLGVEFAYSIEDLHQYTFASDGYSVQKDGQTVEDVSTILSEWAQKKTEDKNTTDELDDPTNESPDLVKMDQENKNNKSYVKTDDTTNTSTNTEITEETEDNTAQSKIEKYQDEFDRKILNLFIGNSYYDSDLINPILDYGKITITPQANNTSEMSSTSGSIGNTSTSDTDKTESNSNSGVISVSQPTARAIVGHKKLQELSVEYIRSLTPAMANTMSKNTKYTKKTRVRLVARAKGQFVI